MPPSTQIMPPTDGENNNLVPARDGDLVSFYKGTNIFLTGATGFMGKILLEKLLRVTDVGTIYTLIRNKKGQLPEQRAEAMFDDPVFERLKEERPKFRHQIVPVVGDCGLPGLGMSPEARATLVDNVNIIFHCAATVRFDEDIDIAVNINVRGTKCILDLAKETKNLKCVMHVSTAYSNCPQKEIDEVLYDVPLDCDRIIQLVNAADKRLLERITPTLIDRWPNSYAFTKAVGENVVKVHKGSLPIGVFRPAIVVNTNMEPVPGWIDNLYGPGGVVLASGSGLMHTLQAGKDRIADLVPVDMAVNALLAAAWETASMTPEQRAVQADGVPIYNYVSSVQNPLDWRTFMSLTSKWGLQMPPARAVWSYSLVLCDWWITHMFLTLITHFLPALIVDAVCILIGSPFRLVKVYRKILKFSDVIAYFATQEWHFHNHHVQSLWRSLGDKDKAMFPFDISTLDWDQYFKNYMIGMRLYIFKEQTKDIEWGRIKQRRLWWAHQVLMAVLGLGLLKVSWWLLGAVFSVGGSAPAAALVAAAQGS